MDRFIRQSSALLRYVYLFFSEETPHNKELLFVNTAVLGWFTLIFGAVFLLFNMQLELVNNYALLLLLFSTILALVILHSSTFHSAALFFLCCSIVFFALFLLYFNPSLDWVTLYWFILLPPMFIFSLGLKIGTTLTLIFFIFLSIGLFTASPAIQVTNYSFINAARFILAFAGSFCFSWVTEFIRLRTHFSYMQIVELLEEYALTDPLTNLGNRRDFHNYFNLTHAQSIRFNHEYSLAVIDLDYFKKINDKYGHKVGDIALCHVVNVILSELRPADRLFRWGGEEFVLLLPNTELNDARRLVERLCSKVASTPFIHSNTEISITVSIGLCGKSSHLPMEEQVLIADKNMYKAKAAGRNQVQG